MDLFNYVFVLMPIFDYAVSANFGYLYRSLESFTNIPRKSLVQCARTRFRDSIGIMFNPVNSDCAKLPYRWWTDQRTIEGYVYLLKLISDEEYVPPKYFYNINGTHVDFEQQPPMKFQDRSKLEMYFSSSNSNNQFVIVLRKNADYLLRVTIKYASSTMHFNAKYGNDWSNHSLVLPVPFTINKVEKLSFRTIGSGFEVHHDDHLLTTYNDPSSPHDLANTKLVTIWLSNGSHVNLHRIIYTK